LSHTSHSTPLHPFSYFIELIFYSLKSVLLANSEILGDIREVHVSGKPSNSCSCHVFTTSFW